MVTRIGSTVGLVGSLGLLVMGATAVATEHTNGCASIAAAIEEAGGKTSAEEIAKKLDTDIETVRGCWKEWEAKKSKSGAAGQPES